ncbi:MAG: hypothetical protein MI725_00865, partial [Pirellulales bacterium]|nr:hypothetical protein [Pirellulales bacterium]
MRCLTLGMVCAGLWLGWAASALTQTHAPTQSGNVMLANVLATMQRHASITARVRHQARMYQHTLVGSGDYWQQGTGDKPLTRWEMNTLIAGKTASYVQVFDGAYLWTDRRLPSGRQVHRLDVELLQSRLRHGRQARHDLLLATEGQGGLAQMLAALLHKYNFDQPRPTQLNG